MEKENDENITKKLSLKKVLFNSLFVSLSILVLGFVINYKYAVGYIFILVIHELGHYIIAKFLKVSVAFGGFTPVGAYIIHENPKNCKENALIAMGGPLFGGLLGLIYYIVYYVTGNNTFLVLTFTSIILNLGNLIPVSPLDGGQIAEAISPTLCYIGFPVLIYLFILLNSLKSKILLLFIIVAGIYQTYYFTMKYKTDPYYKLDKPSKIKFIFIYSILVLSLTISAIYLYNSFDFKDIFHSIARFK
ncbi:site-2 protease family protein [Methanosarcina acetivorans]|uniref:Peptidase M50 domain-containing protein n=1 Tax=Methanosarcina acetivorans (strain ATCC 35395 / DSM 2834 / JCM 12185 / C2A) TaxID=188937 RepID=Q8TS20_METAC|nr:site-2 protease family protein [Methanosarcina acetivorans]AAM04419.1 conserved hypothetical protein [Methanosarcina acetivorans C2A]